MDQWQFLSFKLLVMVVLHRLILLCFFELFPTRLLMIPVVPGDDVGFRDFVTPHLTSLSNCCVIFLYTAA